MPDSLDVRFRALALDGTVLFDADTPPGAYEVVDLTEPGITWRRQKVTSPFVDGDVEAGATREANTVAAVIRVLGSSGQQVNERRAVLTDAVAGSPWWLCEVTLAGVRSTWRANRADWTASSDKHELVARPVRRLVTLAIPVQPSRAVTYASA